MLNPISSIRLGAGALALILGVAAPASARFRTRGPIVCKDSQHMTVYNVRIATRGVAVIAKDNCELTIVKSQIRAGVAIKASENAVVKLVRCDVSGQKSAVVASDNAEVHAKRGTIWGAIRTSDNGEFKGRARRMKRARPLGVLTVGGVVAVRTGSGTTAVRTGTGGVAMRVGPNGVSVRTGHGRTTVRTGHGRTTVRTGPGGVAVRTGPGGVAVRTGPGGVAVRTGPGGVAVRTGPGGVAVRTGPGGVAVRTGPGSAARIPHGLKARGPIVCRGSNDFTVRNAYIRTRGAALRIIGSCNVTLINTHLISNKGAAIVITGSGDVTLKHCYVKGRGRSMALRGSGDVTVRNSTVIGKVSKVGSGDLVKRGRNVFRRR